MKLRETVTFRVPGDAAYTFVKGETVPRRFYEHLPERLRPARTTRPAGKETPAAVKIEVDDPKGDADGPRTTDS